VVCALRTPGLCRHEGVSAVELAGPILSMVKRTQDERPVDAVYELLDAYAIPGIVAKVHGQRCFRPDDDVRPRFRALQGAGE
jgi:hypothetical protein